MSPIYFVNAWWFLFGLCVGATSTSLIIRSFIL